MQGLVGFPVDCTFYFIIFEVNLLYNIALVSMKLEMPSHLLHLDYFVCSKIEIAEHQEIDTIQGSHSLSFQSLLNNIKYYPGITLLHKRQNSLTVWTDLRGWPGMKPMQGFLPAAYNHALQKHLGNCLGGVGNRVILPFILFPHGGNIGLITLIIIFY